MRARTCKKCFALCGYYPEWINGSPYCPKCADIKKAELEAKKAINQPT